MKHFIELQGSLAPHRIVIPGPRGLSVLVSPGQGVVAWGNEKARPLGGQLYVENPERRGQPCTESPPGTLTPRYGPVLPSGTHLPYLRIPSDRSCGDHTLDYYIVFVRAPVHRVL